MAVVDERSWNLPDGFKRGPDEPDGFQHVPKNARDRFAQSGIEFDPWTAVEANRRATEDMEGMIEQIAKTAEPGIRKLIAPLENDGEL